MRVGALPATGRQGLSVRWHKHTPGLFLIASTYLSNHPIDRQHLDGDTGAGASSQVVELFLLTGMLSGGKRGMPLLREHAAAVIVRRFHELPAIASDDRDEEQQGQEGEEGERTIGREEVLRAALECLMG